ncbi:hypothetical protein A0O34_01245 [Chryseobacterium glaciei]|uniref:Uncharacterized protein n=1 Tax=Chryseobacterium glaciei TaxID=1685010 RepID=A0A172XQZ9_9FLAO|nr:hypothetical protein A0O34_01245 [Chryseobacterium glaciei]
MKKLTVIVLIISLIYVILSIYFQSDFFLEFTPVMLFILILNFYIIHQHNKKVIFYIINSLILLILIYFLWIGIALRQDW